MLQRFVNLIITKLCYFVLMTSRVSQLYLIGNYKLNKANPSYFNSVFGELSFLLFVHPEVEQAITHRAFHPLVEDLRNISCLLEIPICSHGESRGVVFDVLNAASLIQKRLKHEELTS